MNRRRVRLAIGSITPNARRAIDAAIELARATGDPVDCLFVEDADLFVAAALPITREMGVTTAAPRQFDARALASALRRHAEIARAEVADAARRSQVSFTFEVARGDLLREPLQRADSGDVIVIGVGGIEIESLRAHAGRERGGARLLAILESFPEALTILRAALGAMPGARAEAWPRAPAHSGDDAAFDQLLRALEAELGRPLRRVTPPRTDAPLSLAEVLSHVKPRMLAIERSALAGASPELLRALRRLGITVLAAPGSKR